MKYKVLVSDALSDEGLNILNTEEDIEVTVNTKLSPSELKREIKKYDALIIRSGTTATAEIIENADNLKVIGRAGVGVDNVDIDAASKKGIVVMNTPSGNTLSTAEQTIAMLLALSRNIPQAFASMKEKKWDRKSFKGVEVNGKVLGVIGFGRIGREVAKRMQAFGMEIVVFDPYATADMANRLSVKLVEDVNELFKTADYITAHTPLTEATKYLINKDAFAIMKKGVRIINCARGGIVSEKDLAEAIESGKVAGAALDVYEQEPPSFDNPLFGFDNVICVPHLGASTKEAQINVAVDVARQVIDMLKHDDIKNAVNIPYISPEVFKQLAPYMKLAEKIGALVSSLEQGRYKEINIQYSGDVCEFNTVPLSTAVIQGILIPILGQENVNNVNAPIIAKERGIKVKEEKTKDIEDFAHLISVNMKTEQGVEITVAGTLFGLNDVRIVRINGYHVDASPEGVLLICENHDKPGFVGKIGTILGANNINIANMSLGRKEKGKNALVVFNIDDKIPSHVLDAIKALEQIVEAKVIDL
jgi:D-3-phosphoglycerate dehydrogenase / 2-oxoglutarate reductase